MIKVNHATFGECWLIKVLNTWPVVTTVAGVATPTPETTVTVNALIAQTKDGTFHIVALSTLTLLSL